MNKPQRSTFSGMLLALIISVGIVFAAPAFAQEVDLESFAELAGFTTGVGITTIIARLIRTAIGLVGVIAVGFILYGGFMWMTAGGSADRVSSAKKIMINSIIGLVLVFSSFAIVSFVLSALTDATSGDISSSDSTSSSSYSDSSSSSSSFYLSSVNTDCSESLQNLELQFIFSKNADEDSINDGGIVVAAGGTTVDGTYSRSGKTVTFTPDQTCEDLGYSDLYCFDATSDYTITLDASVLESSTGSSLDCSTQYPCTYSFTTGSGVDIDDPTVSIDSPDDGESIVVGIEKLQAETTDDTGVSTVYFYVVDDDEAVYASGVNYSSAEALLGGDEANYFFTDDSEEWDSSGYTTNEKYNIWAKGVDCAGNKDTASKVEIVLRASNCSNGIWDTDYEDELDCGGDSDSAYYCGACEGDSCQESSDCSSGRCEDGECVDAPKIKDVSPGDGAEGNLVTISGEGFGDSEGTVTFLGTESGDEQEVSAYSCNEQTQWADDEIVIQVPTGAVDGPIVVTNTDAETDRTDDDYGTSISDFDVNAIERPGLCLIDPDEGVVGDAVAPTGIGMGDSKGSSTFYFSGYEASSYVSWSDSDLSVVVPNVNSGSFRGQVFTGDYQCLDESGEATGTSCDEDDDCDEESGESCSGTSWCSETLDYCGDDDDCEDGAGSCESLRVGSNKIKFTVSDESSDSTPVITSVNSGWEACNGGSDDGEQCAIDDDCESGSCADAPNWGPAEQYITIFGSNFGSSKGSVYFENEALGYEAIGDAEFPEYCSEDYWHDSYITVKVPQAYLTEAEDEIESGTHNLYIVRQDNVESEAVDFVVLSGSPGPSICDISPSAGPVGTEVTIYGERFDADDGEVQFYSEVVADISSSVWGDEDITSVPVPEGGVTGPVYVIDSEGYSSNAFTFAIGSCNEVAGLCQTGEECCADGSCSTDCQEDEEVESHYAYLISTATIPETPSVVVQCDLETGVISPSVWEGWTDADETCLNSAITATFDTKMDTASITKSTVTVEVCDSTDDDGECESWSTLTPSGFSKTHYTFTWYPATNSDGTPAFENDSWYQVTLDGGGDSGDIRSHEDAGSAYLAEDFTWEFRTSSESDYCEVGAVNVTPTTYTSESENEKIDYLAQLVAANDDCQVLSCDGYALSWDSSDSGAYIEDSEPGEGVCENVVVSIAETPVDEPAQIEATVMDVENEPTDAADLTINFKDPEIDDYSPDCQTACINALPFAVFNTDMDWDTIDEYSVTMYACEDSLCENSGSETTEVTFIDSVSRNEDENRFEINFADGEFMEPDSWYRIVLDGDKIESESGVELSDSGSNYGTAPNQYYTSDFSWKFKTKNSDVSCGIDSISLAPEEALMSYVGEKQAFDATAIGAPDDCDASGQELQAGDYDWSAWAAEDTPDVYGDEVVAYMIKDGSIELSSDLPDWCTSSCLNAGASVQEGDAVCGDGEADSTYEECDDGNTDDDDGCSSICLLEGSEACDETTTSSCCGDSSVLSGVEECDDGGVEDGDGCSAECLNEGSRSVGSTCGDNSTDHANATGGEDCDDGNTTNGDGCSSQCLSEGSDAYDPDAPVCGNGTTDTGEDCDDGNTTDDDGCSSACLNEGTSQCVYVCSSSGASCSSDADCDEDAGESCGTYASPCCGDSSVGTGEDCDGGADGEEGCSSACLYEGSSVYYDDVSFCGDGGIGTGEECETESTDFEVGAYGVSVVDSGAVFEVSETTGYAISTITATVNEFEDGSGDDVLGTATLQLECSCSTDESCGVEGVGCGAANCCFERPKIGDVSPTGSDVCRNTAVWVEFDEVMDSDSFDQTDDANGDGKISEDEFEANIYLDLISSSDGFVADSDDCPSLYTTLTYASGYPDGSNAIVRAWYWVKQFVSGLFGRDASASKAFGCYLPVSFEVEETADGSRVYLRYASLLEEDSVYQLHVVGDQDETDGSNEGVTSTNGVSLCLGGDCSGAIFRKQFTVGDEVCLLDKVKVEDTGRIDAEEYESLSKEFFTETDEEHQFLATPYSYREASGQYEEISPVTGVYDWSMSMATASEIDDVVSLADGDSGDDGDTNFVALGADGDETIVATATIETDEISEEDESSEEEEDTADKTTGTLEVTALLCENPWPELDSDLGFPFVETDESTNFSFYYCRDAGDQGDTSDDLPALEDPIDVTSLESTGILQELIFKVEDTSDAIGVRVLPNEEYLSASAWVESQGFTGTFSDTEIDGYDAVSSGSTIYVAAANQDEGSGIIYPNIYVISYNENAGEEAGEIFEAILDNWGLNANDDVVTDINLCEDTDGYVTDDEGDYVSCSWDGDCSDGATCDADKAKLTRDMKRLTDITDMIAIVDNYGEAKRHCAVTKTTSCFVDAQCPGDEACIAGYPDVQSGTFVPAMTNSVWSSWTAVLSNDLGTAIPQDPINEFYNCSEDGYDSASCWNGSEGVFVCPDNSHLYAYQGVGGEAYKLYSMLESSANAYWAYAIDDLTNGDGTVSIEYADGNEPSATLMGGFASSPDFCDGQAKGDSVICGDGVQGSSEDCEIGDTKDIACTPDTGVIAVACTDECVYQSQSEAEDAGSECVPYECGNGVIEDDEECDDGELNGTYGHCGDDCSAESGFYCGDGYLAGGEECDCGTTGLYDYSDGESDDTSSWAYLNACDTSNGQYSDDITTSCTYNCLSPGLSCGDEEVNGDEECDGDYEDWEGALCDDGSTTCQTDSDCSGIGSETCADTYAACGVGDVCADFDDAGDSCDRDSDCDSEDCDGGECAGASDVGDQCSSDSPTDCESESCPDFDYDLFRYRNCNSSCQWPASSDGYWSECVGGSQLCGNGTIEGTEECDDGNNSNNDACLNTCEANICGDDYVYSGVESCDNGDDNGEACDASYGGTCNYCNVSCQYKTLSGAYCGDGEVNGSEECDGDYSVALTYFDGDDSTYGDCDAEGETTEHASSGETYYCQWLGVCNGGDDNGDICTLDLAQYQDDGTFAALSSSEDGASDQCEVECVAPVCASDCGSSCPTNFETTGLLVQSELAGASKSDSVQLYSYQNSDGDTPDNAVVYVPACTVGSQMSADIDRSGAELASLDIIFLTDLSSSMNNTPSGEDDRRIDYVVEATKDAVDDLFDAYGGSDAEVNIGLVSYSTEYYEADSSDTYCNSTSSGSVTGQPNGTWRDQNLSDDSDKNDIMDTLEDYKTCVGSGSGGSPAYNGIDAAINALALGSADVQVVVILSDGGIMINDQFYDKDDDDSDGTYNQHCDESSETKEGTTYSGANACTVQMADLIAENSGISFYSATITGSSGSSTKKKRGRMAHVSSNDCAWDTITSVDDCEGNYAFSGTDADDISEMYDSIVESVLGTTLSITATDNDGNTQTTTTEITSGSGVEIPFPDGFVCKDEEQTLPFRHELTSGDGSLNFSNFEFTYCPYDDGSAEGDGAEEEGGSCGDDSVDVEDGEYCDGEEFQYYCYAASYNPDERDAYACGATYADCECDTGYSRGAGPMGFCDEGEATYDGVDYQYDGELCTTSAVSSSVNALYACGDEDGVEGECIADTCGSQCATSDVGYSLGETDEPEREEEAEEEAEEEEAEEEEETASTGSTTYCFEGSYTPEDRDVFSCEEGECNCEDAPGDYEEIASVYGTCEGGRATVDGVATEFDGAYCTSESSADENYYECGDGSLEVGVCVASE